MEIRILGCYGAEMPGYRATCFMINGSILVDAGAVTSVLYPEEQRKISDILITHPHLDHIKDIPLMADNILDDIVNANFHTVNIISSKEVIDILKTHIFNSKIWPDFSKIPTHENAVIRFREIPLDTPFEVGNLTVTAIEVSHTVPALGYIIDDGKSSLAISGDTCVTDKFWEKVNSVKNIKAVFLETSFPNEMTELANVSCHLTPAMMAGELKKLENHKVPVYLYHLKPNFLKALEEQISEVGHRDVSILKMDNTLTF